jgi:mono/diheme cytochrome c family protein
MISAAMPGRLPIAAAASTLIASAAALGGCGTSAIKLQSSNPYYHGAKLFADHCSGCHTLDVTGSEGSATRVRDRERTDAPNFNVRKEQVDQVLYAIRNGGFSGAIMPENIVVGKDAQAIAAFLGRYSGLKAAAAATKPASGQGESSQGPSGPP